LQERDRKWLSVVVDAEVFYFQAIPLSVIPNSLLAPLSDLDLNGVNEFGWPALEVTFENAWHSAPPL
jgi:hypothetical protein